METDSSQQQSITHVGLIAVAVAVILVAAVLVVHQWTVKRAGTIVLPGGVTYLGPEESSTKDKPTVAPADSLGGGKYIPIAEDAPWVTQTGKLFPYSFQHPSLSLGVFPGDPFDAVTIFWSNTNPQENILLRVEDLNTVPDGKSYITKPKKNYVNSWWKQYSWKGVGSITSFTNSKGLKGYRAKYTNALGESPFDNVFFEVPGHPEKVIWMATKLLPPAVFDKIVDSLQWGK